MNNIQTKQIESGIINIINGINQTCDIITSTMGGAGKNVIIKHGRNMNFTKDGVTVAKSISLSDPILNIGSNLVINASDKTVQQCGDGTTATALFIKHLVNGLVKENIPVADYLDELDRATKQLESLILDRSKKIEYNQDIYHVAFTSCKSASLAKLIADIYAETSLNANITLELSKFSDTTYRELTKGLNFQTGMVNSRFANQENGNCVFENCYIHVESGAVSNFAEYTELLDDFLNSDKALVIIAPQFSDTFVRACVTNKVQKGLQICLIKAPGYSQAALKDNYRDIAAFTSDAYANKIVISEYEFTIFNEPELTQLNKRVKQLKSMADNATEDFVERDYLNRITNLTQNGAIIYVGGTTESNAKEEFDRIEDALGAVKSAIRGGYIKGAGVELYQLSQYFTDYSISDTLIDTMKAPFNTILKNAHVTKEIKTDIPYNVKSKQYDENIIDPSDVIINSFKNAVALVKLLINTSYTIYNE